METNIFNSNSNSSNSNSNNSNNSNSNSSNSNNSNSNNSNNSNINTYSNVYVDCHTHLADDQYNNDQDTIITKCIQYGLQHIVVNGLEPVSNRRVLELCEKYSETKNTSSSSSSSLPLLLPALGIYPIDALCHYINDITNNDNIQWSFTFPPPALFDIEAEINFIETMAREKKIVAIGECGLDKKYYDNDDTTAIQEEVLRKLMRIGKLYDIPLIIHSRKAEARVLEMLIEEGIVKADFHSFSGDTKLGVEIARHGYYLSIPSVVEKGSSFQSLAKAIPLNKILTETDAPFLSPDKGVRNDPSTIPRGVIAIAKVKKISVDEVALTVRENFRCLFNV